ncbi:MAG TPA: UbiA family prenyltransferase [Candidatus Acidoferrales bacterium]|nr:UbiA family prenyltransferase [Candidatus Acidoferrales bacterium]
MVTQLKTKLRAFVRLVRFPYWLLLGIICILLMMVFQRGSYNFELMGLASLTVALTSMGGFAINDYFDRESDAIVKPDRPIPSNQITPLGAIQISVLLFLAGLGIAAAINLLALGIAAFAIVFLILYAAFFKRRSGFVSNIVIGLLAGTVITLFSEATVLNTVSILSLCSIGFSLLIAGRNVFKDVAGVEGDMKIGVSSLAIKQGKHTAAKVGVLLCFFAIITSPLPYFVGVVSVAYLVPITLMSCIIFYVALSIFKKPSVENVKRQLKMFSASEILIPIALVAGIFFLR